LRNAIINMAELVRERTKRELRRKLFITFTAPICTNELQIADLLWHMRGVCSTRLRILIWLVFVYLTFDVTPCANHNCNRRLVAYR
jgi:hypothetical protein